MTETAQQRYQEVRNKVLLLTATMRILMFLTRMRFLLLIYNTLAQYLTT